MLTPANPPKNTERVICPLSTDVFGDFAIPSRYFARNPSIIDKKARKAVALTGFKKVLKKGLEPLWLAPYEPESYVSTNFTT